MRSGFQTAVSLLYPPRCLWCGDQVVSDFGLCGPCWRETPFISGTRCEACGAPVPGAADGHRIECDDCMKRPRPWSHGRSALVYGGHARKMILAFKHGDRPEIARPAARWMVQAVREILVPDMLVAPLPLHWSRLIRRRYNQSALLAGALSDEIGCEFCPDLLKRIRRTPMLDHLGTEARFETLASAIRVHRPRVEKLNSRSVLLVDDVMTSGATLTACAKASLDAGAREVRVVAMARSCKS